MMRLAAIFFALTVSQVFAQAQKLPGDKWAYYGEEFYKTLAGSQKIEKEYVHNILNALHSPSAGKFDTIKDECVPGSACYRHTYVSYSESRLIMFGELDKLTDSKGTYVFDVYCGRKFYYERLQDVGGMHTEVNIEHTWPQSRFTRAYEKNMQKSDMHHLYLSDSKANSVRGNNWFSEDQPEGGEGCSSYNSYLVQASASYTPPKGHRGNVARSLFYFATRYQLPIDARQEAMLRRWHKDDPVNDADRARHAGIVKIQKVRNPFIDHPELVDRIIDF